MATVVVVGLLAVQVCPNPDVEQSGSGDSEEWVTVSLAPALLLELTEISSRPMEPCLEELGVTVQP